MTLKKKLNRLKSHISKSDENLPPVFLEKKKEIEIPHLDQWKEVNVKPYYFDNNFCLIREVIYPLSHQHGNYYLSDFLTAVQLWNQNKVNHPLSAHGHSPDDLFFFDTETTGLGGGVGNTIFLLGYASIKDNNVILRQHILPHPGAEIPLYQSFLENVNYKTLVTYNGKSFDWPQVKTRHTLVREHVPKLPSFGHFDLYHASRRMWKHKLERLKLSIVEDEILGFKRIDDIPGYLAPMIYFDFIESKNPNGMIGILKHNENDILSLITLYTHLTFQLYGHDQRQSRNEMFEVGRWFASLGENDEAVLHLSKLIDGNDETAAKAKLAMAFHYKKAQEWDMALHLFKEIADLFGENSIKTEACIEAAKILEHKKKNFHLAIEYSIKAMNMHDDINLNNHNPLKKRISRLQRKCKKNIE